MDPSKTRMVIRFETPDLGQVAVVFDVADTKLWCTFNSEDPGTHQLILQNSVELKDRMESLNYSLISLQSFHRKIDLRKLLIPTLSLDRMNRVRTEV